MKNYLCFVLDKTYTDLDTDICIISQNAVKYTLLLFKSLNWWLSRNTFQMAGSCLMGNLFFGHKVLQTIEIEILLF